MCLSQTQKENLSRFPVGKFSFKFKLPFLAWQKKGETKQSRTAAPLLFFEWSFDEGFGLSLAYG